MLSVMLFPDDLDLARKCVAHFLSSGTLQDTLGAGVQIDKPYMAAIISDLADGRDPLPPKNESLGLRFQSDDRTQKVLLDPTDRLQAALLRLGAGLKARISPLEAPPMRRMPNRFLGPPAAGSPWQMPTVCLRNGGAADGRR